MKRKFIVCLPCVALGLVFSSCGDKKPADDSANNEQDTSLEIEELRNVGGFAQHLPVDTEMFFNAQNIDELIGSMRGSELGQMMVKLAKNEGDDIDEAMKTEEFQEFLNVAGEEVFISMGDGSGKSLKIIGDTYSIYYRMYYYIFGKIMLDTAQGTGMMMNPGQVQEIVQSMTKPVLDEFLEMDDYQMPRVYAGFKVSSDGDRTRYTKLLQETFAKALELNDQIPDLKATSANLNL